MPTSNKSTLNCLHTQPQLLGVLSSDASQSFALQVGHQHEVLVWRLAAMHCNASQSKCRLPSAAAVSSMTIQDVVL